MSEKKLSVQQNMLMNSIGMMTYLVCQWLVGVLAVRLGGYGDNGLYTLAVSMSNFFYVIASFNLRHFQVSDTEQRYSVSRYVSTRLLTLGLSMLIVLGFVLANSQYSLRQSLCIIFYALYRMSEATGDVLAAEEQRARRMDYICVSMCLRGILALAVFTGVMSMTHDLPLALAMMAVICFCVVMIYDWRVVRRITDFHVRLSVRKSLPLLKEAWGLMVASAMVTLLTAIPKYFLEFYAGSEIIGIYGAVATPAVVVQAGCSFIYTPLVAPLADLWHERDFTAYRKTLMKTLLAVCALMLVICIGGAILGDWGLRLVFTDSIAPYTYLFVPVLFTTFFMALLYLFEVPMTIARRQKTMMLAHIITVLCSIVLSMALIPRMGMEGVNLVICITAGLDALFLGIFAFRVASPARN